MYRLHLSSAYGFYNHLILRFQSEFNSILQLDGFLDFPLLCIEKQPATKDSSQENRDLLKEVATRILHKFLICLGDLARYQIEYDPSGCTKLAYKYYQMSLILMPSNGMPLNQLGTLYGSENYGCDAAYYYLYCLCCSDPFLSASENLRLLFAKNRKNFGLNLFSRFNNCLYVFYFSKGKRYDEIKSKKYIDRGKLNDYHLVELRTKEIKKFLVLFLYIIDLIYTQSSQIDNQHLQEMCQLCLQEFNSCMFYTTNLNNDNEIDGNNLNENKSLSFLSDELVFKLTLIILMTIENLKSSKRLNLGLNTSNSKMATSIYFTSVAFALVFFSHIVNHTIIRLQESLLSMNKKNRPLNLNMKKGEDEDELDLEQTKEMSNANEKGVNVSNSSKQDDSSKEKPSKKRLRLIYGQRRRKHNSDSDTNDEDESEYSDNEDSNSNSFNSSMYSEEDEEGIFFSFLNLNRSPEKGHKRVLSTRDKRKFLRKNISQFF
jgi:protein SMG5